MITDNQTHNLVINLNNKNMKNTIIIIISLLTFFSCKAQIIKPIYDVEDLPEYDTTYYKDVDNDYNNFIGTWRWQDGNTSLTFIFHKVEYVEHIGLGDFFDHLIGEYIYIENGVEIINTLPSPILTNPDGTPNIAKPDPLDNNINSYDIRTSHGYIPPCEECAPNTRFVIAHLNDPLRPKVEGRISMGHFTENGVEKIKANIGVSFIDRYVTYTGPTTLTIPDGIYTFTKVE